MGGPTKNSKRKHIFCIACPLTFSSVSPFICRGKPEHQLNSFSVSNSNGMWLFPCFRCGNVAAILELDEHLQRDFTIFEAAPQESRGIPCKKPQAEYFL